MTIKCPDHQGKSAVVVELEELHKVGRCVTHVLSLTQKLTLSNVFVLLLSSQGVDTFLDSISAIRSFGLVLVLSSVRMGQKPQKAAPKTNKTLMHQQNCMYGGRQTFRCICLRELLSPGRQIQFSLYSELLENVNEKLKKNGANT